MTEFEISPEDQMMQWITSKWISKPIHVAAQLGIADLLQDQPLGIEVLAEKTDTHTSSLYRMLRALAAVGVFAEVEDRVFGLTPLARCLCSDRMRPLALMFLSDWHDQAWIHLTHSIRTGKPAFDQAFGQPSFDWLEKHPEGRAVLDQGQGIKAIGFAEAVLDAFDLTELHSICDVGGGKGVFLTRLLADHPHIQGLVADLPGAIPAAEKTIEKAGLGDRCKAVPLDFLKESPPESQTYFLVNVLHDWDDEICHQILKNVSRSMKGDSRLLVMEYILEPGPGFSVAKLLDMEMLVMSGGRERTIGEYQALLESVGLAFSKVIPTSLGPALLECTA